MDIHENVWNKEKIESEKITNLANTLKGKMIVGVEFTENSVTLVLNNDTKFIAAARCGVGADSNWYNWTEVTLNGEKLIDK